MYKIYINEKPLLLMKASDLEGLPSEMGSSLKSRYTGRPKFLLQHVDFLEKTTEENLVIIYSNNLEELWRDFKKLFKIIKAAGGLVYNPDGEVLAIYRRGFWDLPKGKIDKGEKKKQAAIREVMEETGLKKAKIEYKLMNTWHTYKDKRFGRVLKKTFWFRMSSNDQDLVPQKEEDIEQAIWIQPNNLKQQNPIYYNILEVLNC